MIALVQPSVDPAVEYVRQLPWAPSILLAGAASLGFASFALTRRHPGEAGLAFTLAGGALALVLVELGQGRLGFAVAWVAACVALGAALVAGVARRVPGAPRTAPGNEQRLLALGLVAVLAAAIAIAALAVDWPRRDAASVSAAVAAGALGAAGLVGVLTRRHGVSLVLAATLSMLALAALTVTLPFPQAASFAFLLLAFAALLGAGGLALTAASLERGHGPWIEPLEEEAS